MKPLLRDATKAVLLAAVGALVCYWAYERFLVSDQRRVLRTLEKARRSIEHRSLGDFMALISPDYRDEWDLGVEEVKAVAFEVIRTYPVIEVDILEPEVTVGDEAASITCYARVVVQNAAGERQEMGREYTRGEALRINLKKREREWLIRGVFKAAGQQ